MRIGLVGLGDMGAAIAPRLREAGHRVAGFDPDARRVAAFRSAGFAAASTVASLAADSDAILSLLPSEAALYQTADHLAGRAALWIECSTLSVAAKEAARATFGKAMVDAPISGTAEQTAAGAATAFLSGEPNAVVRARQMLDGPLARVTEVGTFGNGTRVKLCANLLVPLHTACAAEAILLAEAQGLDAGVMLAAIAGGPASSAMLELRGARMISGRHRPASGKLSVIAKDRTLVEQAARGVPLALFRTAFRFFDAATAADPEADLSAVIEAMRQADTAKSGGT